MKYLFTLMIGFAILFAVFSARNQSSKHVSSISPTISQPITQAAVIAENLDTPWGIAFLPDKSMLVTERPGRVRLIDSNGNLDKTPVSTVQDAKEISEGGLLGITLHPEFSSNNYVYLYYTYTSNGENTLNRVVRMTYKDKKLTDEKIILDKIPGASNHNGGRIKFGPDKLLYIGTGDAQNPSQAQNTTTLGGKILRITDTGEVPSDNPFHNAVYTYGHRNVQGLTWDNQGRLWATEHGRSGIQSGLDEINLIEKGKNYGWPVIQGDEKKEGMETPRINSGPAITWAPSGLAFLDGSLYFGGLRGRTLYEVRIDNLELKELFKNEFGRLRDVVVGPDGLLYVTTSNQDGRGNPNSGDDKIIRVNPKSL